MNADEDEIIQEIPIYVSQTLAKQLFIYQYPTRPGHTSCGDMDIVKSCIKPQLQEVELELSIDTRSSNYDEGRGEQIAINADGITGSSKPGEERTFSSGKMDHMTLKSQRLLSDTSNYAIGVLNEGELHLTPLKGIVSLRPTFSYLDKSDKRQGHSQDEQSGGEEEEEMKQVKVKFARQENERAKKAREQSYDYHNKLSSSEPWFHTNYIHPHSDEAEHERSKLFCPKLTERVAELSLGCSEYLDQLIDPEAVDDSTSGSTRHNLKSMNLADQVRHLMKEARLMSFRQLIAMIPPPVDQQTVLRTVQTVAVLVRGNWVVRSDVIYPKDSFSGTNGVPAEVMCRSRDYVLSQLNQHRFLDRVKVSAVLKLPTSELLEILNGVAILRRNKGWELKLPSDKDFIERFAESVQRQEMWWEAKQRQLNEAFRHKPQSPPASPVKSRGSRSASRRRDSSVSSDGEGRPTHGRPRKKSVSQSPSGLEADLQILTNGTNDTHILQPSTPKQKSSGLTNESSRTTESKHVNNSLPHSAVPNKRTKLCTVEDNTAS